METIIKDLKAQGLTDYGLAKLAEEIDRYLINKCDNKSISEEDWCGKKYCYGDFCDKALDNFYFDSMTGEVLLYT